MCVLKHSSSRKSFSKLRGCCRSRFPEISLYLRMCRTEPLLCRFCTRRHHLILHSSIASLIVACRLPFGLEVDRVLSPNPPGSRLRRSGAKMHEEASNSSHSWPSSAVRRRFRARSLRACVPLLHYATCDMHRQIDYACFNKKTDTRAKPRRGEEEEEEGAPRPPPPPPPPAARASVH